mgnify:CR=1 FL=1
MEFSIFSIAVDWVAGVSLFSQIAVGISAIVSTVAIVLSFWRRDEKKP